MALAASVASPSVVASAVPRYFPDVPMGGPDNSLIDGAYNQPYTIANYQVDGRKVDVGVPVGFWRSVGFSYNSFMHESFIDEIAHAGKTDPLALRLKLMADYPVALAVVEKVAAMSGWQTPPPAAGRAVWRSRSPSAPGWRRWWRSRSRMQVSASKRCGALPIRAWCSIRQTTRRS